MIEVRIVQEGLSFNEEDDIAFELPNVLNDRGAVSLYCGELNNTVGVRYRLNNLKLAQTNKKAASMTATTVFMKRRKYASRTALTSWSPGKTKYSEKHLLYSPSTTPVMVSL